MSLTIRKASGESEAFIPEKIKRSLRRIGASENLILQIIEGIERAPEIVSTSDVYHYVYNYLKSVDRPLACRYDLKNALYLLGPEGFLFEKFVAELFRAQNYATMNDLIVKGTCVDHEIDVIALKNAYHFMIECKFHNSPGIKTDIKTALYIKARYDDVLHAPITFGHGAGTLNRPWLATNTKFTTDAINYAACVNMGLIGWAYPEKTSIETMVDYYKLYPITCLASLSTYHKKQLLEQGIFLCKELIENTGALVSIGLQKQQAQQVQEECKAIVT